ncbi:MAG: hypothetical protein NXI19_05295 [Alphaproteobacteria bacterium]|jgi:hypothetical protein|nr:hypothetical protein [Alphaproteobacteria bacterium]
MSDKSNPPDHPVDPLQPGSVPFSKPPRPKAPDAEGADNKDEKTPERGESTKKDH